MVAVGIVGLLFLLGILAAAVSLCYFLFRGLQADHEMGEYHFTWTVGIVVLFLMGLAPGFVGLGLYLTVERHYPLHWLVLCLFLGVVVLLVGGIGVWTGVEVTEFEVTEGM